MGLKPRGEKKLSNAQTQRKKYLLKEKRILKKQFSRQKFKKNFPLSHKEKK